MTSLPVWHLVVSTLLVLSPIQIGEPVPGPTGAAKPSDVTMVGASPYLGGGLATDGRRVIYSESNDPSGGNFDVLGIDLASRQRVSIAAGPGQQSSPDVDGDYAVWYVLTDERQAIDAMHLPTGEVFTVSETQYGNHDPKISGDWVAWQHFTEDGAFSLMVRNIRTMEPAWALYSIPDGFHFPTRWFYQFDDDNVLLYERTDYRADPNTWIERWRLSLLSLDDPNPVILAEEDAVYDYVMDSDHTATLNPRYGIAPPRVLRFQGDLLIYDEWEFPVSRRLLMLNVSTGEQHQLAAFEFLEGTDNFGNPNFIGSYYVDGIAATDGRFVFWLGLDEADSIAAPELRGLDTESGTVFTAVEGRGDDHSSDAFWIMTAADGVLVWTYSCNSCGYNNPIAREIHAARIFDLVPDSLKPTTPVPPTGDADSNRYFPETGHTLQHGFLDFWERNGGLAVFGYPLTEEFWEVPPDFGERFTVQYLERQRLEWHPENAGTSYEVLLGRLGYDDAEQRGLLDTAPFQPRLADDGIPGHCTSFSETGHIVCNEFDSYWASHGVDLGDPGVSYRESLALFGYPLSEPFVDPATGLLTQYFERAVFEYYPDNDAPFKVLLRRLGADVLPAFGLS